MTIDNERDRPFGAGKVVEETWTTENLNDPEDEEILSDEAMEDDLMDDPDDAEQLDEDDPDNGPYGQRRRDPLTRDQV